MRVASWNINGIRARSERVDTWLKQREPDVVALQELRDTSGVFGRAMFAQTGYDLTQTNHVAIASREPISNVVDVMGDGRALIADTSAGPVLAVYVPNGRKAGTPQHAAKLEWLQAFTNEVSSHLVNHPQLIVAGDLNIARADLDVWAPDRYRKRNLFTNEERSALARLLGLGLVDVFRESHGEVAGLYSWWNYAHDSFNRNRGWRLDYILTTPQIASRTAHAIVDVVERSADATSDHAPLWLDLTT